MAISVMRPVPAQWPITGEYLQTDDVWTPDRPHLGVDFGCPLNTIVSSATIRAEVDGIYDWTNFGDGSFGRCVVTDVLGTPYFYIYAHLNVANVVVGQIVDPGDRIGLSGNTGKNGPGTYAPHLHVQASTDRSFPRANYEEITGDPILGLRSALPPVTAPVVEPTLAEVNALVLAQGNSIALISERVIAGDAKLDAILAWIANAPKG